MRTLRLKIADLVESAGLTPPDQSPDVAAVTPLGIDDVCMDLDEPFLKALEMHQQRGGKR